LRARIIRLPCTTAILPAATIIPAWNLLIERASARTAKVVVSRFEIKIRLSAFSRKLFLSLCFLLLNILLLIFFMISLFSLLLTDPTENGRGFQTTIPFGHAFLLKLHPCSVLFSKKAALKRSSTFFSSYSRPIRELTIAWFVVNLFRFNSCCLLSSFI
jgi:hypothetical protein